jgi:hyperosmotically inducible protein
MKAQHLIVAIVLTAGLAACERSDRDVKVDLKVDKLPAQAERQVERAAAVLDDAALTAKVKTALIAERRLNGLAIDVDTSANVVTLNGTVASEELRRQAEQLARAIDGVKEVKNNLTIKPAS